MKSLVVNCSDRHYNLGANKLARWLRAEGHEATMAAGDPGIFAYGFDKVFLSVIFTWHAPVARDIALRVKGHADVECGGPGIFRLADWWTEQTGLKIHRGIDRRFDKQPGDYLMTFASRGCDEGCSFCIVPSFEGRRYTLNWDFTPAPILCDNNLSALPEEFQEHIIKRYKETSTRLRDANSGFSPSRFTEKTYERWKEILEGPWRFALDEMKELDDVERTMRILSQVRPRMKRVYVLAGNEPISACYERAMKVIEWGGEPFCQFERPLDYISGPIPTKYDWTEQMGKDFCRYFNRYVWRSAPIWEYSNRQNEAPPFAFMRPATAA